MTRDIWNVASYEVTEAFRSKRVVVFMLLYVGGAVVGTYIFVSILQSIEQALASAVDVGTGSQPGAMTRQLLDSPRFLSTLSGLIGDDDLAKQLVTLPPLSLFYGWLALTFLPTIVTLTAAETVASELSSGAIRYQLLRVDRIAYSVGKLLGQTVLMVISIALGAAAVFAVGMLELSEFDPIQTAGWLVRLSARAGIFAFAYVGLVVGISHTTRSAPLARGLGLLGLMAMGALSGLSKLSLFDDYRTWVDTLRVILPGTHELALWHLDFGDRVSAMASLLALGVCYFGAGFVYRSRRDL